MVPEKVKLAYRAMRKIERDVGGGEGTGGTYGSITETGVQKILDMMKNYGLSTNSVFTDVGAGLARPLVHAHISPGVAETIGFENDYEKCSKARTLLDRVYAQKVVPPASKTLLVCGTISAKPELFNRATHVYAFWQGFSLADRLSFGRMFHKSRKARCICVVQNVRDGFGSDPEGAMGFLGFGPLLLAGKIPVDAQGGGQFTAFIFVKRKRRRFG